MVMELCFPLTRPWTCGAYPQSTSVNQATRKPQLQTAWSGGLPINDACVAQRLDQSTPIIVMPSCDDSERFETSKQGKIGRKSGEGVTSFLSCNAGSIKTRSWKAWMKQHADTFRGCPRSFETLINIGRSWIRSVNPEIGC